MRRRTTVLLSFIFSPFALAACSAAATDTAAPLAETPDGARADDDGSEEAVGGSDPSVQRDAGKDAEGKDAARPDGAHTDSGAIDASPPMAKTGVLSSAVRATCVVTSTKAVKCWGEGAFGGAGTTSMTSSTTPVTVPGITATRVAIGGGFGCAVTPTGTAKCWGSNAGGQLGNGTTTDSYASAVDVSGLTNVVDISAEPAMGTPHACAIAGGATYCWGGNGQGDVGNGTTTYTNVLTPSAVVGLSANGHQVVAGFGRSCALSTSGAVTCWGVDALGQAQTSSGVPTGLAGLSSGVVAIDVEMNGCALLDTGAVKCWGTNGYGELGAGYFGDPPTPRPVDVSGIGASAPAAAISVGPYNACALMADGTVRCWGFGAGGVLGNGSKTSSNVPVVVQGVASAVAVAVGSQHACALLASGKAKCWGQNDQGQLGNGTHTESTIPVDVVGL